MAIPAQQLETWSHQGATVSSSQAYARIRNALTSFRSSGTGTLIQPEIYLQGSYANATNTYGDSDVDVVVQYNDVHYYDVSEVPYPPSFSVAQYRWNDFRNDVIAALRGQFGNQAVVLGKKSIKLHSAQGRPADVVPVILFRRYHSYTSPSSFNATEGMKFFDSAGNEVTNYPKLHIENGEAKNNVLRTGGRFKPTVRVFKNIRSHLVDNGLLRDGQAPSYFVECLLYNVPDNHFVGALVSTVPAILNYLRNTPYEKFVTQNHQAYLFGNSTTQWNATDFVSFLQAAIKLWNG